VDLTGAGDDAVNRAIDALREGKPVLLPADGVYGLVATAQTEAATRGLYALKGREATQPTALIAPGVDALFECIPELRGRPGVVARALLPGAFTLVLPNPARRFRWLTGANAETIGVRVPDVHGIARDVLELVGVVAATSANLHGGPDPRRLEDVPAEIRAAVAVEIDGGELPGLPSTVLDLTGAEPRVLREGAVSAADALKRLEAALAE